MSQSAAVDPNLTAPTPGSAAGAASGPVSGSSPTAMLVGGLYEATKPGITRLVTITSVVGFVLAAPSREWTTGSLVAALAGCVAGTALSAAGANAVNQFLERGRDAAMPRTMLRPIPSGRVAPGVVLWAGLLLTALGLLVLTLVNGWVPAAVSLACFLTYTLVYTPMKPWTPAATLVGTIPGALPPLIGWTSATPTPGPAGLWEAGGMVLFAIMTVWQIPHFLAIAWMYKDDYAKGGYAVLPVLDPSGSRTAWTMLVTALLLLPATLAPVWLVPERVGWTYGMVAAITGAAYVWLVVRLVRSRDRRSARAVFFGSIAHLPVILFAISAESLVRWVV